MKMNLITTTVITQCFEIVDENAFYKALGKYEKDSGDCRVTAAEFIHYLACKYNLLKKKLPAYIVAGNEELITSSVRVIGNTALLRKIGE